jgi:hypothetical protein
MLLPPTKPILTRLRPLHAAFEEWPGLAVELADLLDWTPYEVRDLLNGQIEPSGEDMVIINAMLKHRRRIVRVNQDKKLAA